MKRLFFIAAWLLISNAAQAHMPPPPTASEDTNTVWYIADGNGAQCIPTTGDVVGMMEGYWKAHGGQVAENVVPPGYWMVTIFQGSDHMVQVFQDESICRQYLPIAIRVAQEQRSH